MTENLKIPRRHAALLASAALVGCTDGPGARAQGAGPGAAAQTAPPNVVLPVPMPCITQPDDIVAMVLEGPSEASVLVIGQAFRAGDLPRGAGLQARLVGGAALTTQFDLKVRHPDGSARHGIVSIAVPALGRGERRGVILARGAPGAAEALDVGQALGGRAAALEITPLVAGEPWRVDLLALWQRNLQAQLWQSGPLCVQGRVTVQVPATAVGGATSMRLVADIAVRSDGTLWTDIWLRNDIAQRPGGGVATYSALLTIDGREMLKADLPQHPQYQAFGRIRGAKPGGEAPPSAPFFRHDMSYLADTAAIPRYDQSTGASIRVLENWAQRMAQPDWDQPLGQRMVSISQMGAPGGRGDIGPVTGWQSHWICSADRRAAATALGQAEAAGAAPWHIWDATAGSWLDTRAWPNLWADGRGGPPPGGLLQVPGRAARSHQPDLCYVPYLLTGRQGFLDGLMAQAAWNIMFTGAQYRRDNGPAAIIPNVNVIRDSQVRSIAWVMRQLSNAAWITPDANPQGRYFRDAASTNWLWVRSKLREWTALQGEAHGWFMAYRSGATEPPWQNDYLASTVALAARRGDDDARTVLQWMSNFLVGRFFAEDKGFPRQDGVAYQINVHSGPTANAPPLRTWEEIGRATRIANHSNDGTWRTSLNADYSRWALQALAQVAETLNDARASEAYLWLLNAGAPRVEPQIYAEVSQINIVWKDFVRVPSRALACRG